MNQNGPPRHENIVTPFEVSFLNSPMALSILPMTWLLGIALPDS